MKSVGHSRQSFRQDGNREVVAIKSVDKGSLSKSAVDNLVTEIRLLNVLKHEHIVEMRDFFWDEGFVRFFFLLRLSLITLVW